MEKWGVRQQFTAPYTPQENPTERTNRTVKTMIAQMAEEEHNKWDEHLPELMLAYNSSTSESTKFSPAQLIFGKELRLPNTVFDAATAGSGLTAESINNRWKRLNNLREEATANMQEAAGRQKQHYDLRNMQRLQESMRKFRQRHASIAAATRTAVAIEATAMAGGTRKRTAPARMGTAASASEESAVPAGRRRIAHGPRTTAEALQQEPGNTGETAARHQAPIQVTQPACASSNAHERSPARGNRPGQPTPPTSQRPRSPARSSRQQQTTMPGRQLSPPHGSHPSRPHGSHQNQPIAPAGQQTRSPSRSSRQRQARMPVRQLSPPQGSHSSRPTTPTNERSQPSSSRQQRPEVQQQAPTRAQYQAPPGQAGDYGSRRKEHARPHPPGPAATSPDRDIIEIHSDEETTHGWRIPTGAQLSKEAVRGIKERLARKRYGQQQAWITRDGSMTWRVVVSRNNKVTLVEHSANKRRGECDE
nr:serine/arginine repetitive matrix protein 2-like [Drosophila kikkawai]